jgi:hypothetical protein
MRCVNFSTSILSTLCSGPAKYPIILNGPAWEYSALPAMKKTTKRKNIGNRIIEVELAM